MADIKTRDVVKGTIKKIDKAAIAADRMRSAYVQTKEKAEHATRPDEHNAEEYASDRVEGGVDRITHETAHQFDKQGRKGLEETKRYDLHQSFRFPYEVHYYSNGERYYSYRCGNYMTDSAKQTHNCTCHYISEKTLCALLLNSIQRISKRVIADERGFAEELKEILFRPLDNQFGMYCR